MSHQNLPGREEDGVEPGDKILELIMRSRILIMLLIIGKHQRW